MDDRSTVPPADPSADAEQREEALRLAIEATGLGIWDVDVLAGARRWSPEFKAILGVPPDFPPDRDAFASLIHPDDRERVDAEYASHYASGAESRYEAEFRIRRANDGAERWVVTTGRIHVDEVGRATRGVGTLQDVTDRRRAEEAMRLGEERFGLIVDSARDFAIFTLDLEGRVTSWNSGAARIFGWTAEEIVGRLYDDLFTAEERCAGRPAEDRRRALAEEGADTEGWRLRSDGERIWASGRLNPLHGPGGEVQGFLKIVRDRTDKQREEDARKLLLDELNHRVKNTLATVQSIAALTLKSTPSPEAYRDAFTARLGALSQAHDLLTRAEWRGASLEEVVRLTLAPYAGRVEGRVALGGPPVRLSPNAAVTLHMALHELATNAAKYGALSNDYGGVEARWEREGDAVRLDWTEQGGPPVAAPQRRGFGSRLLEAGVAQELAGEVDLDFTPSGLRCRMILPLSAKVALQGGPG